MITLLVHDALPPYGIGAFLTFVALGIRALNMSDAGRQSEMLPVPECLAIIVLWPAALVVAVLIGVVGIARHGVDRALPDADSTKNLRHLSRKQASTLAYETQRLELARALNDEHERTTRFILGEAEPPQVAIEAKPGEWVRGR